MKKPDDQLQAAANIRATIWPAARAVSCILTGHAIAITPFFEMPVRGLALLIAPLFAGLFAGASRQSPVLLGASCCALPSSLVMLAGFTFTASEELGDHGGGAGAAIIVAYSAVIGAIGAKIASRTFRVAEPNQDEDRQETD